MSFAFEKKTIETRKAGLAAEQKSLELRSRARYSNEPFFEIYYYKTI